MAAGPPGPAGASEAGRPVQSSDSDQEASRCQENDAHSGLFVTSALCTLSVPAETLAPKSVRNFVRVHL